MSHSFLDVAGFRGQRSKDIARALSARVVQLTQIDDEPGRAGKEHDERESGREKVYVALRGSGVVRVDGAELAIRPGLFVHVSPDSTRQVVAGDEGLSYLVVGAAVRDG